MKKIVLFTAALVCVAGVKAQETTDTLAQQQLDEVVVAGVRAQKTAPYAVANIKKNELEAFSKGGRELPFLFSQTPGVLAWGENGLGTGTVAMRIRGAAGSRINVTLDGVALNSPEDQTVFWANMNSYASLLGSVQIQRGIGTSTNGDGAFGGSVSLATSMPGTSPSLEISGSYGSYGTYNAGMKFSTGLLFNHLVFDGAYHETSTDGYIHGTSGRSGSYYGGLTWLGDRFRISYKNIGNFEKTGQAWNGIVTGSDDLTLMDGTYGEKTGITTYKDLYGRGLGKFNPLYEYLTTDDNGAFVKDANGNYMTERFKMRDGSYWNKTTDNFYQNHNILSTAFQPSDHWSHNIALHYTYGYGYYSEFKQNAKFAKFGLTFYDKDGDFVKKSDFVRKKGLTQHTYGIVYNLNYKDEHWNVLGGLNLQQFRGGHFGYLTYIKNEQADGKYRPNGRDYQYYDSDARKFDYSGYFKADYRFADYWNIFMDLQYRHVEYKTDGLNDKFYKDGNGYRNQQLTISERYDFVNPKAGISYYRGGHKAYASIAYANREPERNNFTDNGSYPAPTPERMMDIELGYQYYGTNWHAGVNLYYMDYNNQFVQTGAKSDIGENLTTNVKSSYRMGAELEAGWSPLSWLTLEGNAALSRNSIKDFDEMASVDWDDSFRKIHYDNSVLAFSPSAILNGFLNLHYKGLEAVWHTNFVSRQYLDNTENLTRSLPCYSQSNLNISYTLRPNKRLAGLKEAVFGISMNNLFNRHYAASGWVYSSILDNDGHPNENRYTQIGFIPMAGFNMMGNVTLKF
ncbi:MAG: TonB-dependent receptor [Prevotella sp.]|nr:TonB-dependent receptor [Prevotella sp.]